MREKRTQ